MGFGANIDVYKKYKDLTLQDIEVIERLLAYETNDWAKKQFKSAEEYAKYDNNYYKEQSVGAVDFYRNNLITDEFGGKYIYESYGEWCSNGTELYNYIMEIAPAENKIDNYKVILDKKLVAQIFNYCIEKFYEIMPQPAEIKYAYKYSRDENGEVPEDADINLFKCDGFEVKFDEDNSTQRIDTNPEWGCVAGFPKNYYDEWEMSGYKIGIETCVKLLSEVDFENNYVVYHGGW